MKNFDVIIIGGGAAGMMAAISTKQHNPNLTVAIIDRTFALGRKILVCGAGRCNITNINLSKESEKRYYGASKEFISDIINQFDFNSIVNFFEDLGVDLYVERKTDIGKLFPVTNQASTITEMLNDEIERLGIEVFLNTEVKDVTKESNFNIFCQTVKNKDNKIEEEIEFSSKYLIVSAGGMSYPALGSNGSGYLLSKAFGHKIIEPVPSALPVESKNQLSHFLQGVRIDAEVTSIIDGKEIKKSTDEVMFTKYGFSGPAILNISREISIRLNREKKGGVQINFNFFPSKTSDEVKDFLEERWKKRPTQTIEKSLYGIFPNKMSRALLELANIDSSKPVKDLKNNEVDSLINYLTNYKADIHSTRGWNEAEFTAGGIDTSDVKQGTLESKLIENLYFAGEILNVDGDVGGFNLSWAWSSGFVVGKSINDRA